VTKLLDQGDRVCKAQKFGVVDAVIERYERNILVLRIVVVEWDDGTTSDEDEDNLDTVLVNGLTAVGSSM
jgi:hypothetical protein